MDFYAAKLLAEEMASAPMNPASVVETSYGWFFEPADNRKRGMSEGCLEIRKGNPVLIFKGEGRRVWSFLPALRLEECVKLANAELNDKNPGLRL